MLSLLDRHIRAWHFWLANAVAVGWFVAMGLATQSALPGVKLFRCPIGLCLGYYSPNELYTTLTRIGRPGREFLADMLLPFDTALPALLLIAFTVTYVWFSRPGQAVAVPLSSGVRYAFLCVPLFYSLADYAENWTLVEALQAYPNIPYRLARRASILTATKSQLVMASIGIAVALVVAAWGTSRSGNDGHHRLGEDRQPPWR